MKMMDFNIMNIGVKMKIVGERRLTKFAIIVSMKYHGGMSKKWSVIGVVKELDIIIREIKKRELFIIIIARNVWVILR